MSDLTDIYKKHIRERAARNIPDHPYSMDLAYVSHKEAERSLTLRILVQPWMDDGHGNLSRGILSYIFDSTLGLVTSPTRGNRYFVTLNLAVRYRNNVRVGEHLLLTNRLVDENERNNLLTSTAVVEERGVVAAEAEGTFMVIPGRVNRAAKALEEMEQ